MSAIKSNPDYAEKTFAESAKISISAFSAVNKGVRNGKKNGSFDFSDKIDQTTDNLSNRKKV